MSSTNRTVLIAVDTGDSSKFAFDWYLEQIHRPDDLVVVTHCPETPKLATFKFKSGLAPPVDEWKTVLEESNRKANKLAEDYEGTLIQKKLTYKIKGENVKKPGEGILRIATDENADMIVMGSRSQGALKRAVLGSVSEYVVRNAQVPVVIVPQKFAGRMRSASQLSGDESRGRSSSHTS